MPHTARRRGSSGFYHVVPKGIGGQSIFGSDSDRNRYLELLSEAKDQTGIRVYAYCLMSNHVHYLIEDARGNSERIAGESISDALKYVHERYGMQYANIIGRRDGVFRKPFWSEPVETNGHLLCAIRYIHNNPAAAGLCSAFRYAWSSAGDYLGIPGACGIADTDLVLGMLGGRKGFLEWSARGRSTAHPFPGSKLRSHLTDDEAIRIACDVLGHDPRNATTPAEARLLLERGFYPSLIERITGLTRYQIRKNA